MTQTRSRSPRERPSAWRRTLPEIVEPLSPLRAWEAIELEAALAEGFIGAANPWVEGGH